MSAIISLEELRLESLDRPVELKSPRHLARQAQEAIELFLANREEITQGLQGEKNFTPAGSGKIIKTLVVSEVQYESSADKIDVTTILAGGKTWKTTPLESNIPILREFYEQFGAFHAGVVDFHKNIISQLGLNMGLLRFIMTRFQAYSEPSVDETEEGEEQTKVKKINGMEPHTDDDEITSLFIREGDSKDKSYYYIDQDETPHFLAPNKENCLLQTGMGLFKGGPIHGVIIPPGADTARVTIATYNARLIRLILGNLRSRVKMRMYRKKLRELGLIS